MRSVANISQEEKKCTIDEETVVKNVDAINSAMIEAKFPKEVKKLTVSKEDVNKLVEIIPILDALDEGVALIGGEKYSTGSAATYPVSLSRNSSSS